MLLTVISSRSGIATKCLPYRSVSFYRCLASDVQPHGSKRTFYLQSSTHSGLAKTAIDSSNNQFIVGRRTVVNSQFATNHCFVRWAHTSSNAEDEDQQKAAKSATSVGSNIANTTTGSTQLVESKWVRFKRAAKREALHYWHGAKLLWIDMKIATGLVSRITKGEQLSRRERKQLARTTADVFRLVPFSAFVLIPFLEFTLPIFLKLFPNMLPSTFADEKNELKSRHRSLKVKLEMAKFLQDTLEQSAALKKTTGTITSDPSDATATTMQEFADFMQRVRTSGKLASPDEIKKFSKLFEDELTLDTMTRSQLQACCKLLEISALGPIGLLRHRLRVRLRELEADDMMILQEGIDSLTIWELQSACRERGMRSTGVSEERLRSQLQDWLTLNIRDKMPTTLLLLSRAMYVPEHLPVEDQLTKVINLLPDIAAMQAQLRAGERSGEKVSNTLMMEVIRKEQEAIATERAELKKAAQAENPGDAAGKASTQTASASTSELKEADAANLETAIEQVAAKQHGAAVEQAELAELKQDVREYKDELQSAMRSDVKETKVTQRLAKRIDRLIGQVDTLVDGLQKQRESLAKEKMVAVDDLLRELAKLQQAAAKRQAAGKVEALDESRAAAEEAKWERILQTLDYDRDGQISVKDAVKLVEMLKDEKVSLGEEDVAEMVEALRHESELEQTLPKVEARQEQKPAK